MKKILLITHWFYPMNVPRAFRAKELYDQLKKAYDVDLLIGDYKQFISYKDEYNFDKHKNVENKYKGALSNKWIVQKLKNIFEYFIGERYLLSAGAYIYRNLKRLSDYDAVISIGIPFYIHLLTAMKLKKNSKIVSVSDWSDPFYVDNSHKYARYFKYLQKYACKRFDYIVIPTEKAKNYFLNFTDENKIKIIPQGFNFSNVQIDEYKKNIVPTFAYAGIFYEDIRNPEQFLEYLCTLKYDFKFIIYTVTYGKIYNSILLKYKEKLGDKLVINARIDRMECIKKLSKMDFLINIENTTSEQVPSKLIDYALSKRPILSFKPNNIPKNDFEDFCLGKYHKQYTLNLDEYDIKNVTEKFIRLLEGRDYEDKI